MPMNRVVVVLSEKNPKDKRQAELKQYRFTPVDGPLCMRLGYDTILSEIKKCQPPNPLGTYDPSNCFDHEYVNDGRGSRNIFRLKPIPESIRNIVSTYVEKIGGDEGEHELYNISTVYPNTAGVENPNDTI